MLIVLVNSVRRYFDRAVNINSGYRSVAHNKAIGGAKGSRHPMGMAADIDVRGVHPDEVYKYLEGFAPGGLGHYQTFTHVDVDGANRRWDNRI